MKPIDFTEFDTLLARADGEGPMLTEQENFVFTAHCTVWARQFREYIRTLEAELSSIDNILSRREALDDLNTRTEKIARAIRIASERDINGMCARLEAELAAKNK